MKHLYIIFLALLACCPEVIHAENEISYLAEIGIQNRGVVKKGREVQLTMLVDLSELKIKTQHTIALTPILLSKDGNREAAFPPIVIDGKARNKMYLRAQRLESVDIPPTRMHRLSSVAVTVKIRGTSIWRQSLTNTGCSMGGSNCVSRCMGV